MAISVDRQVAKAKQAIKKGNIALAKKLYGEVLHAFPNNIRVREALEKLDTGRTGKIRPTGSNLSANIEHMGHLFRQNRFGDAIDLGQALLRQNPRSYDVYNILGAANSMLEQWEEAVDCFSKAMEINPNSADVNNNLGNALKEMNRPEDAIESYKKALQLDPRHFDAHNNLGVVYKSMRELPTAINWFRQALKINPKSPKAHYNLGNAYQGMSETDEAVRCYLQAIDLKPDYANAYKNLAVTHYLLHSSEAARINLEKALHFLPDDNLLKTMKLRVCAELCDWESVYADPEFISTSGISDNHNLSVTILSLEDAPARHLARSQRYARHFSYDELPRIPSPATMPDRLRIGYFSAEFHQHACMVLMAKLFEVHDRNRFSLHAFSYGPDKNDSMRERVKSAFDEFHDLRGMTDREIAERARELDIDIAVHITGYTRNHRTGIFAYRAAPVQVSYLGYPGTLGAPFIDYMITDNTIVPPEYREHYTEKLICLPDTYMVSDNTREISDRQISRAEMKLPEHGFVFCCFNANSKITPQEFDVWMRLLQNVEGSVLWLREDSEEAAQNLRAQATHRNVDPGRLVFAQRMPSLSEHLARHRLADLFLDTFNYNAHTTACDALWAGLPVLTKIGQGFAARVAASLLTAAGLPELITSSVEEYETLALELANNPDELIRIRSDLDQNRNQAPLFDTEKFARHIEAGYRQAYERYCEDQSPADIFVTG